MGRIKPTISSNCCTLVTSSQCAENILQKPCHENTITSVIMETTTTVFSKAVAVSIPSTARTVHTPPMEPLGSKMGTGGSLPGQQQDSHNDRHDPQSSDFILRRHLLL